MTLNPVTIKYCAFYPDLTPHFVEKAERSHKRKR